jgi:hypothetical protein
MEHCMGWLVPKTFLMWREPRAARRKRESLAEASLSRMARPAVVFFIAAILLLMWFLATLDPNKHPPRFLAVLPIALGTGMVFVYAFPLMYWLCPSQVRLTERGITQVVGDHATIWAYEDVQCCRIIKEEQGSESSRILEVNTSKGSFILGIAETVSLDDVERNLIEQNVQVVREDC